MFPTLVFSHSGGTDSSGGHHCWTDCESHGYEYGEYHNHNSGSDWSSWESDDSDDDLSPSNVKADNYNNGDTGESNYSDYDVPPGGGVKADDYEMLETEKYESINDDIETNNDENVNIEKHQGHDEQREVKGIVEQVETILLSSYPIEVITYMVLGAVGAVTLGFIKNFIRKKSKRS